MGYGLLGSPGPLVVSSPDRTAAYRSGWSRSSRATVFRS